MFLPPDGVREGCPSPVVVRSFVPFFLPRYRISDYERLDKTNREYASRCLRNQLPVFLRQHHPSLSISGLPLSAPVTSSSVDWPLWPFITSSLFHFRPKPDIFRRSFPPQTFFVFQYFLHGLLPGLFLLSNSVFVFFCSVLCFFFCFWFRLVD